MINERIWHTGDPIPDGIPAVIDSYTYQWACGCSHTETRGEGQSPSNTWCDKHSPVSAYPPEFVDEDCECGWSSQSHAEAHAAWARKHEPFNP